MAATKKSDTFLRFARGTGRGNTEKLKKPKNEFRTADG
jgi:hypothetical protein